MSEPTKSAEQDALQGEAPVSFAFGYAEVEAALRMHGMDPSHESFKQLDLIQGELPDGVTLAGVSGLFSRGYLKSDTGSIEDLHLEGPLLVVQQALSEATDWYQLGFLSGTEGVDRTTIVRFGENHLLVQYGPYKSLIFSLLDNSETLATTVWNMLESLFAQDGRAVLVATATRASGPRNEFEAQNPDGIAIRLHEPTEGQVDVYQEGLTLDVCGASDEGQELPVLRVVTGEELDELIEELFS